MVDVRKVYQEHQALLEGHFLLSSGNHSKYYLQSARVLENPKVAEQLATALASEIRQSNINIDLVCSPALGGLLIGYELARALGVRFIFAERKDGKMEIRRGFSISKGENVLICEDIITTGGSALEVADEVEKLGGNVVGFSALANRGFCSRVGSDIAPKESCKLPKDKPLFALDDFIFEIYSPEKCPLCAEGDKPIKPGSRGN
ncbi:MAG TPA: orotate phosphoribosyltransferase [Campylobacterales bacterium]|nr:orotate phosphoribosyltransferase [Campylobacterales bacterium]HIO70478.1 orotate phosphoribosyltransferase [Campylobacterales bacterium]